MPSSDSKLTIPSEATHMMQANSLHLGMVKDVKDPEGRGRVKVECSSLNHVTKENWIHWCEVASIPVSTLYNDGDFGQWWPLVPGQPVFVTFFMPNYLDPVCFPGPGTAKEPEKIGAELIPKDAKVIMDKDLRQGTRIRVIKTEAGHSLVFDDNGQQESMHLVDFTGAGFFWATPGKEKDEQEKEGDESKWRKGQVRGTKTSMAQTAPKPSEISKNGTCIAGFLDVNGQGFVSVAKDGEGIFAMFAGTEPGKCDPSIILDAKNQAIFLTAGEVQQQILGKQDAIYVTKQMIWECIKEDPKEFFEPLIEGVKEYFSKFDE